MEFHIQFHGAPPDLSAIEHAVHAADPSALVDIEPVARTLRVAASIDAIGLAAIVSQAGFPVTPQQIVQIPSICCGGCSG